MSFVNLVSGGLDSTLIGVLAKEAGVKMHPLFIDYGQRAARLEWEACQLVHTQHNLPAPVRMNISGYGRIILSSLTYEEMDLINDAFTPGRNLLFLVAGSAYAYQVGADAVAIGLLSERYSLFPDQKTTFVIRAEAAIEAALGRRIKVLTPLAEFSKVDVMELAKKKGISGTYSCHSGNQEPCGQCISCLESSKRGG